MKHYKKLNINKAAYAVIISNIMQVVVVGIIVLKKIFYNMNGKVVNNITDIDIILLIIVLILCFNTFGLIKNFYCFFKQSQGNNDIQTTLEQVESLNNTLRGQRHDFINHLQVIYSLIEMNEYIEAKDYVDRVFTDIQKVSKVLKTSNPAVNALLQAKIIYGEKRGIKTELNVSSRLEKLKIPAWEFCRVLGNIIDNAIYALQEISDDSNKVIQIEIFEDMVVYGFKISNNGPKIATEIIDCIFNPNFTTKGEKGEGMGLAISKQILTQYGGGIKVESDENKTIFYGWIAK